MRSAAPWLVAALLLTSVGCARRPREAPRPVDERLLVALEQARAWQHRADLHVELSDLAAARRDVEEVLKLPFPDGAPEGEEARLDAWARLGRLQLLAGDESAALEAVAKGRGEARRDSFYRAHLEMIEGEILEARAKRLSPTNGDAATVARRQALAAYERSIAINQRVQAALLRESP